MLVMEYEPGVWLLGATATVLEMSTVGYGFEMFVVLYGLEMFVVEYGRLGRGV
jgi:hypothetical protein